MTVRHESGREIDTHTDRERHTESEIERERESEQREGHACNRYSVHRPRRWPPPPLQPSMHTRATEIYIDRGRVDGATSNPQPSETTSFNEHVYEHRHGGVWWCGGTVRRTRDEEVVIRCAEMNVVNECIGGKMFLTQLQD